MAQAGKYLETESMLRCRPSLRCSADSVFRGLAPAFEVVSPLRTRWIRELNVVSRAPTNASGLFAPVVARLLLQRISVEQQQQKQARQAGAVSGSIRAGAMGEPVPPMAVASGAATEADVYDAALGWTAAARRRVLRERSGGRGVHAYDAFSAIVGSRSATDATVAAQSLDMGSALAFAAAGCTPCVLPFCPPPPVWESTSANASPFAWPAEAYGDALYRALADGHGSTPLHSVPVVAAATRRCDGQRFYVCLVAARPAPTVALVPTLDFRAMALGLERRHGPAFSKELLVALHCRHLLFVPPVALPQREEDTAPRTLRLPAMALPWSPSSRNNGLGLPLNSERPLELDGGGGAVPDRALVEWLLLGCTSV